MKNLIITILILSITIVAQAFRIPTTAIDRDVAFIAVDATDFQNREEGLSSFTVYYTLDDSETATAMTSPTITELDATNMPGVYMLSVDESGMTTLTAGHDTEELVLHITHAAMAPVTRVIEIYRPETTEGSTSVIQTGDSYASIGTPVALDSGNPTISGMLTKMADDNDGADFDASAHSQKATIDRGNFAWLTGVGATASLVYTVDDIVRTVGDNEGGDNGDVDAVDGAFFVTGELAAGDPPLQVTATFTTTSEDENPIAVWSWCYYQGSPSHHINVMAYNYVTSMLEIIGEIGHSTTLIVYKFDLNPQHINTSTGAINIQFIHEGGDVDSHFLSIDKIIVTTATQSIMLADIAAILDDTAEIGVAGAGLSNIDLPNQTMDISGTITNLLQISGSATAADNLEEAFNDDGTVAGAFEIDRLIFDNSIDNDGHAIHITPGASYISLYMDEGFGLQSFEIVGSAEYAQDFIIGQDLIVATDFTVGGEFGVDDFSTNTFELNGTAFEQVVWEYVTRTLSANAITSNTIAAGAINNAALNADIGSTAYADNIIALAVRKVLDELNLDHLLKIVVASNADMTTEVPDGTVMSNIMSASSDTSTFVVADDSLQGLSEGAAGGGATAQENWEYVTRILTAPDNITTDDSKIKTKSGNVFAFPANQ